MRAGYRRWGTRQWSSRRSHPERFLRRDSTLPGARITPGPARPASVAQVEVITTPPRPSWARIGSRRITAAAQSPAEHIRPDRKDLRDRNHGVARQSPRPGCSRRDRHRPGPARKGEGLSGMVLPDLKALAGQLGHQRHLRHAQGRPGRRDRGPAERRRRGRSAAGSGQMAVARVPAATVHRRCRRRRPTNGHADRDSRTCRSANCRTPTATADRRYRARSHAAAAVRPRQRRQRPSDDRPADDRPQDGSATAAQGDAPRRGSRATTEDGQRSRRNRRNRRDGGTAATTGDSAEAGSVNGPATQRPGPPPEPASRAVDRPEP